MYCVRIMYPNLPGSKFNYEHYFAVHLPLGLGLLKKHFGVAPVRVEADTKPYSAPGVPHPYHMINSLYFKTKDEADAFVRLFGVEEAARLLKEDWPKYTSADPAIQLAEVLDCNPATGQPI